MTSAKEEIIALVDKENNVIGEVSRQKMRFGVDIHRVTYVLVFTPQNTLIVQKRTDDKAFCPGYFGITTGGVVESGETYESCATRELEEELGISIPLTSQGVFFTEGEGYRIWGKLYTACYDKRKHGELTLQPKEVAAVEEMSVDFILSNPEGLSFTPDSLDAFKQYAEKHTQAHPSDPL
ncbi:NUDIX hydrolase [Marinomonas balearica]|uniref:ADP-ribose pyrophosphatase YjhB (NUDIX family) n=1 Tax=Marinomonas balearica TaxID=491947 RepID=A0A4R6M4G6_9GAMM|nr:NUDIX domain-containing protein [Marinomonas balearica]TDO96198.1 ADP-ribose pyrophosphatase YjhB (NUDIX family) [Marinomonas balearica]